MTIHATAICLSPVRRRVGTLLPMAQGKKIKSSDLRMLMARRLKAARMAYKENGAEMARDLGVTPQVLNAYEKGRNFPDEYFMLRFCNLTGCPMDWILRGRMRTEMAVEMAVRIGYFDPGLLQGVSADEVLTGAKSQAEVVAADA